VSAVSHFTVRRILGSRCGGFPFLPVEGTSGGIILAQVWFMWICLVGTPTRSLLNSASLMKLLVAYYCLYGSTDDSLKPAFLDELRLIRSNSPGMCGWLEAISFLL
jgi:hypothetical protein